MKNIFSILKFTLLLVILFAVIYPLAIYGIAQFAPNKGKGETISVNGKVVGYQKIGQKFDKSNYFWGRPSAVDYNAAGSAGSNKGPSNPDYLALVQKRIDTFYNGASVFEKIGDSIGYGDGFGKWIGSKYFARRRFDSGETSGERKKII